MGFSLWHLMVVLFAVVILFGLGKLPNAMGDIAKGIRNFKKEMEKDDDEVKILPTPSNSSEKKQTSSKKNKIK